MDSKFSLKWKEFQLNVTKSFRDLRKENNFYDVTLVSDDQKQVPAHKVVLSASSEYFSNILKQNTHSHLLICLDGISSTDLDNMLDYVYLGEVQIYEEDLVRFLEVAEKFKLEGLLQQEQNERKAFKDTEEYQDHSNVKDIVSEDHFVNIMKRERSSTHSSRVEKINIDDGTDLSNPEELKIKIEQMYTRNSDNSFTCNTCRKSTRKISHIKEHVEGHIEGLSFTCHICGTELGSSGGLRKHKAKIH